ncbi:unnamed protein product, partial [Rodentolepis nana]|uniref:WD_REPEATS_REGION domain-containing protein n=1 Tax=Rodentolepis nana TaxID=102285 RepID=A0A0R3TSA2_RODNA
MAAGGVHMLRFTRKSASISRVSPVFIKQNNLLIYASDKIIYAHDILTGKDVYKISSHGDVITKLWIEDNKLFSCGLDTKIIVSDIQTGRCLSRHSLKYPIACLVNNSSTYVATLEGKDKNFITVFKSSFDQGNVIFPNFESITAYDVNNHFVAAITNTKLYLHWFKYNDYTCYTLPIGEKSQLNRLKRLTCVACHPTEPIVATGNAKGEIMMWWNLVRISSHSHERVEEDDSDVEDSLTDTVGDKEDIGNYHAMKHIPNDDFRLLHPKRVKRSVMHWHCFSMTALTFTREGKHLYSGGLEGVLVKWDLTDSFGEVKNRRFLSMLNSPVQSICAPSGVAGDCVVVCLERNSFFVMNGAMQILYKHTSLDQTPSRWRWAAKKVSNSTIALALASPEKIDGDNISNSASSFPILLPGALGCLQIVNAVNAKIINTMEMNQRNYVLCDNVPVPLISEALLVDSWSDGQWLVTYSQLQLPKMNAKRQYLAGCQLDNQAQIVWWRRNSTTTGFTYEAIYGESIAYLKSQATDLKFTCHPESQHCFQTLLILRDQRVITWQYNPASEVQQNQRPWRKVGCFSLDPNLIFYSMLDDSSKEKAVLSSALPNPKVAILKAKVELEEKTVLHRSREEAIDALKEEGPKSILICASRLTLRTFAWIRWISGNMTMEDMLPLHNLDLSTWFKLPKEKDVEKRIIQLAVIDRTASICVALIRPLKRETAFGGLSIIHISPIDGSLSYKSGIFNIKPTGALAVHPSRPIIAVGLMNGSCAIYDESLQSLATFIQTPPLPFCDRQRSVAKKEKNTPFSLPNALVFLPATQSTSVPPLAVIFTTLRGRESGRKDLAVFGLPADASVAEAPKKGQAEKISAPSEQLSSGLLAKVARIDEEEGETGMDQLLLPVHRRKRRLDADDELLRTLRQ